MDKQTPEILNCDAFFDLADFFSEECELDFHELCYDNLYTILKKSAGSSIKLIEKYSEKMEFQTIEEVQEFSSQLMDLNNFFSNFIMLVIEDPDKYMEGCDEIASHLIFLAVEREEISCMEFVYKRLMSLIDELSLEYGHLIERFPDKDFQKDRIELIESGQNFCIAEDDFDLIKKALSVMLKDIAKAFSVLGVFYLVCISEFEVQQKVKHLKVKPNQPCSCGSKKKYKKCCGKKQKVSKLYQRFHPEFPPFSNKEIEKFYKLYCRVLKETVLFCNLNIAEIPISGDVRIPFMSEDYLKIRENFHENRNEIIDQCIDDDSLKEEDKLIFESWKNAVFRRFIVTSLGDYALHLMSMDDSEIKVYEIYCLFDSFSSILDNPLYQMVETGLFPFGDKIIYDGLMYGSPMEMGPGIQESTDRDYLALKNEIIKILV